MTPRRVRAFPTPVGTIPPIQPTRDPIQAGAASHTAPATHGPSDAPRFTINAMGIRTRAWMDAAAYRSRPVSPLEAAMNVTIRDNVRRLGEVLDEAWTVTA